MQAQEVLTRIERHGEELGLPESGDGDVGWLVDDGAIPMSVSLFPDVVHVPHDELRLQGAEDGPDVRLLWGAAAFI